MQFIHITPPYSGILGLCNNLILYLLKKREREIQAPMIIMKNLIMSSKFIQHVQKLKREKEKENRPLLLMEHCT